jgi:hypothetical protein
VQRRSRLATGCAASCVALGTHGRPALLERRGGPPPDCAWLTNSWPRFGAVYYRPRDNPNKWVARRFEVGGGRPDRLPTSDMFVADSVEELRALLPLGLTCIPRNPSDHPVVIESWL